jgi:2-isopropylmalate synthase
VSYILKQNFGIQLPEKMKEEMGYISKSISDVKHKELTPELIYEVFQSEYMGTSHVFQIDECHFKQQEGIIAEVTIGYNKQQKVLKSKGNGRLDSVSNALKQYFSVDYEISCYEEHALEKGSSSKAISYVGITCDDKLYWGVGIDPDIIKSSIQALIAAINRSGQIL